MNIKGNIHYVGVNDRTTPSFDRIWNLPYGVSYNSYIIDDEKIALIDSVEAAFFEEHLSKIRAVIKDRPIDYLIINHMEPDHTGSMRLLRKFYPNIKFVGNKKSFDMVKGFYDACGDDDVEIKNGDTLNIGSTTLQFYITPMIHWPETMMTYDQNNKVLFSGDGFGSFGALNGGVIDKDIDTSNYLKEMERYYACILGKYGKTVQMAIKKVGALPFDTICSTHGPVWQEQKDKALAIYNRLSTGKTSEGLVIAYGSMYGNTKAVAEAIAEGACAAGIHTIKIHDVSTTEISQLLTDVFRYKGLAIGAPTYNGKLYPAMESFILKLCNRETSNHKLGIFGGFSWAGKAVGIMKDFNESLKMDLVEKTLEFRQGTNEKTFIAARELGRKLAEKIKE